MWVEARLPARRDGIESIFWRQREESRLFVFGGTDDGDSLWKHQLIRAVSMEINCGRRDDEI